MPHIWLKNPQIDTMQNEHVKFCGINKYNEILFAVNYKDFDFTLILKQKDENWLLKYDKSTRPSNIEILKLALKDIASSLKAQIVFDNTHSQKETQLDGLINQIDESTLCGKDVFVEVGFGSGVHLQDLAQKSPQNIYIGIEIYQPAIKQLLNRINLENIKNIYAIDEDARVFFQTLNPDLLNGVYVHFPVPWPDAPHRRVWSKEFLQDAFSALKENGFVYLRTDEQSYFEYAKEICESLNAAYEFEVNKELDKISKYEARWRRQNKNIYDLKVYRPKEINYDKLSYNFGFESLPDLDSTIVQDSVIASFKSKYIAKNGASMTKVVLGAVDKPKIFYIKQDDGCIAYWPKVPLKTKANNIAHTILTKGENWKH